MYNKGGTALLGVMIISMIVLIIGSSIATVNIAAGKGLGHYNKETTTFVNADGCAEEALIRMHRNSTYAGESISIDDSSCVISVSGSDSTRVLDIQATNGEYIKKLQIDVTISPTYAITSWQEKST